MPSTTVTKLAIHLDDGPALRGTYSEHRDMIDVSSNLPQWDPAWQAFDSRGHFHARDAGGDAFPTLKAIAEHVECDGSCDDRPCEGYDRTRYTCSICGEDITPGIIQGPRHETIPGRGSWEVTVEASIPDEQQVTVRIDDGQQVIFGVAVAAERQVSCVDDQVTVTTRLIGLTEPGRQDKSRTAE